MSVIIERKVRFVIASLISITVLFGVIESYASLSKFAEAILSVNLFLFFLSDLPYFIQALTMGLRLKLCFQKIGIKISFKNAFLSHLTGMFFSNFSMGRTGYLAASLPVETGFDKSLGVVSTTIAIDAIFKGFAGGLSIIIFSFIFFPYEFTWVGIAVSVLMAGGGALFLLYIWKDITLLEDIVKKIPRFGDKLLTFLEGWKKSIRELKGFALVIFMFPCIGLILRGFEWCILSQACGFYLSVPLAMLLHPMLTILRLIPVTLSGLGVFEFALISILPEYPKASLMVFGILDMVNNAFVDALGLLALKGRKT